MSGTALFQYDNADNTIAITQADATTLAPIQVETRGYDALGRVLTDTVSGPSSPPITTTTRYDENGNVFQVQQPNGDTTVNTYDLADQLSGTLIFTPAIQSKDQATGPQYDAYSYDAAGNLVQHVDADGRISTSSYDGDNRVVQAVDVTTAPTGTTTITTTPQYDPDGNTLQQTTQTTDTSNPGVVQTHTYTATYNAADWLTASSDDGKRTTYGYDGAGRLQSQSQGDPTVITDTLDAEGRVTAIGESTNGTGPYTSTVGYNPDDQPVTLTLSGPVTQTAQYDPDSRLTQLTTSGASGLAAPLASATYGYSANGWTTAATVISGTHTITHDALGRITSESGPSVIASNPSRTYRFTYDGNGNITTASDDFGGLFTYSYSAAQPNELLQSTDPGPQYTSNPSTYFGYDSHGNTTAITTSGALTTTFGISTGISYDAQERPITITHKDGSYSTSTSTVFDTISLQYNAQGQRSRYTVALSGTVLLDQHFQYREGELGQVSAYTATLDKADLHTVTSSGSYTDTFVYDPAGLPLEFVRQRGGTSSHYFYVLDGRNNVVALTDLSGTVVDSYAYDWWGQQLPGLTQQQVPQQYRYGSYWQDDAVGWYWASIRYYEPEVMRWLQPDPSEIDGVRTYAYVGDDPVDAADPIGLGNVPWRNICEYRGTCPLGSGQGSFAAGHAVYMFLIGDDIHTLRTPCSGLGCDAAKAYAVVDLALLFVPVAKVLKVAKLAIRAPGVVARLIRVTAAAAHAHLTRPVIDKAVDLIAKGGGLLRRGGSRLSEAEVQRTLSRLTPNDYYHIFRSPNALARHNLAPLVARLGSEQSVVEAVLRGLNRSALPAAGQFEQVVTIEGTQVTVRGAVVAGVVRIGTMFVP